MASSFSLAQLIVARIVLGIGSGGYTATIPVWQSEISGAQHRGAFVNSEGIFLGLGITISLLVDFGFFFVGENSVSWRFPFALQIILLLMVLAFVFTLPESPRYVVVVSLQSLFQFANTRKVADQERPASRSDRSAKCPSRVQLRSQTGSRRHCSNSAVLGSGCLPKRCPSRLAANGSAKSTPSGRNRLSWPAFPADVRSQPNSRVCHNDIRAASWIPCRQIPRPFNSDA